MRILPLVLLYSFVLTLISCNGVKEEDVIKNLNLADNSSLEINPANKFLYINQSQQFNATGGNPPYVFSLGSGVGNVTQMGLYTAPSTTGQAIVRVTDANGTTKEALIVIQVEITLSPTSRKINVNSSFQFNASGGVTPYTFSVISGSSTVSSNGTFRAAAAPEMATVRVVDRDGAFAEALIEVGNGPIISPTVANIAINSVQQFTSTSGSGPLSWNVITGSGTINSSGLYTAGPLSGTATVRVMDANGFYSDAEITIFKRNKVAAGNNHTCVLLGEGNQVKCFGIRHWGNMGDGKFLIGDEISDMGDNLAPVKFPSTISAEPTILHVGRYFSCAIFTDNLTRCWGASSHGQNGNNTSQVGLLSGTMEAFMLPVPADFGNPIVDLPRKGNSDWFTCGIYQDGSLKCWGLNSNGQLGQNNTINYGSNYTTASIYSANPINLGQTVRQVEVGNHHACVILNDYNVKCWGSNGNGQLGRLDTAQIGDEEGEIEAITALDFTNNIVELALGEGLSCARDSLGRVFCWGRNDFGQLGRNNNFQYGDEAGENPTSLAPINLGAGRTALKIDAGFHHVCALLDNYSMKCWGRNAEGQLGQEDTFHRGDHANEMGDNLPPIFLGTGLTVLDISVGGHNSCALLNTGKVKCWGINSSGQVGIGYDHRVNIGDGGGEMGDNLPELNLGSNVSNVVSLHPHFPLNCALLVENGRNTLKCFGFNEAGNIGIENGGNGDEPSDLGENNLPVNLGTTKNISEVIGGTHHTCTLFTDGSAKCWGLNNNIVLGTNTQSGMAVGVGTNHMGTNLLYVNTGGGVSISKLSFSKELYTGCAILNGTTMKCWGRASEGQLGQNNTTQYTHLPTTPAIDLGVGRTPTDISVGYFNSCAVLDNGSLKCWGSNLFGQLGQGDTVSRGAASGEMAALNPIDLGPGVLAQSICSGVYHNCAITTTGRVKCWGRNSEGQLGIGSNANMGDGAGEMGSNLPFVELGTGRTARKISCGSYYTCALLDNKRVKCWGQNNLGQLGYGNTMTYGFSSAQMGDNLPYVNVGTGRTVEDLATGANHTCVVLDNNNVKCWGNNNFGQLGQGSLLHLGDQLGEMGNNLQPIDLN